MSKPVMKPVSASPEWWEALDQHLETMGIKNRSEFIRQAVEEKVKSQGGTIEDNTRQWGARKDYEMANVLESAINKLQIVVNTLIAKPYMERVMEAYPVAVERINGALDDLAIFSSPDGMKAPVVAVNNAISQLTTIRDTATEYDSVSLANEIGELVSGLKSLRLGLVIRGSETLG